MSHVSCSMISSLTMTTALAASSGSETRRTLDELLAAVPFLNKTGNE